MGLALRIDASELERINARLNELQVRAEDVRGAGPGIRLLVQQDVDERFAAAPSVEAGGAVLGGVSWQPLPEEYLERNPRRRGGQLLRDTGELLQSLTVDGYPGSVFTEEGEDLVFGTALTKAGRLQDQRPFIFWHPELLEKVAEYLVNWVVEEGGPR